MSIAKHAIHKISITKQHPFQKKEQESCNTFILQGKNPNTHPGVVENTELYTQSLGRFPTTHLNNNTQKELNPNLDCSWKH